MLMSVTDRERFAATMRFVHVRLMEILAAWVPTTPEMEVKILLGEHIWDLAQHADALGKRTFELRGALQHSLRPCDAYVDLLKDVSAITVTSQRLSSIYNVMLPGIARRYTDYLGRTDPLSDAPSVRILERHLADIARMLDAARRLLAERPELAEGNSGWTQTLQGREASIDRIVAPAGTVEA
jgi:hypothetical protein